MRGPSKATKIGSPYPKTMSHAPDGQLDQIQTVNQHLRAALNQVEEAVVIIGAVPFDMPGPRIYYANRKAAELTGFRIEELVGAPIGRIYDSKWVMIC